MPATRSPRLWTPRRNSDGGLARIDWDNPLARNLLFATFPRGGQARDLVGGNVGVPYGNATVTAQTRLGPAINGPGASGDGIYFPQNNGSVSAGLGLNYSIAFWLYATSYSGELDVLSLPYQTGVRASPYSQILFLLYPPGLQIFWDYAGTSGQFGSIQFGGITFPTGLHLWAATRNGAGAVIYRDGVRIGASTFSINTVTTYASAGPPHINLLNYSDSAPGEAVAGQMPFAAIWGRTLSDSEMMNLWINPTGLLAEQADPVRSVWLMSTPSTGVTRLFSDTANASATTTGVLVNAAIFSDTANVSATTVGTLTSGQLLSKTTNASATTTSTLNLIYHFTQTSAVSVTDTANLRSNWLLSGVSNVSAVVAQKMLSLATHLIPHPLGLFVSGYDRMGDGVGGRLGHGANSLAITYTILPPGSASLPLSYHVEPVGGTGLLLTYYIQSPYSQFSINGNTTVPAPQHLIYGFAPSVGYDMDGLSVKQGYLTLQWQYDLLFDWQMAILMSLYDPQNPAVTITYLNEMGWWSQKQAMMQPPNLGTRVGITHQNASLTFTHIIPD